MNGFNLILPDIISCYKTQIECKPLVNSSRYANGPNSPKILNANGAPKNVNNDKKILITCLFSTILFPSDL